MDVGMLLVFQNYHENVSDQEVFTRELDMGVDAEKYGFDAVWSAEHHFDDYSMCPDNMQIMSYLAARTSTVKLGTGAVILPWNNPVRVVEKMTMLDMMSGGRALYGMGRGLAKMEYDAFGIPMDEARGRFIEGAKITIEGLRTGVVDNPEGEFYPQSRVEIRPAPNPTYEWGRDRLFGAAMSPDSVPVIADLGVRMMTFMQFEFEKHAETINRWRDLYRERWGTEPLPPVIQDFVICHEDAEEARRLAYEHVARYFLSVIKHYDFAGEHWRNTKGYETYQVGADMIREAGMEAAADAYVEANVYGTPEQIVEKYAARHEKIGDFFANAAFAFGGLPIEQAEKALKLYGEKVVPELHKMKAPVPANA
ncbi:MULTISPECIES: LLM class flavin-dependent oxidoreductase [Rhodococcus]|uniref:LLM class flavin-dependent oxidoreductase n=1 Tax=Rhodococcus rhodochrous TaxID=1829 RepID=A0AAW4XL07_RHORH|nr:MULTISPECIES: LLM class flavin-dependent oxidoreductase [Rhodococcus]MCD2113162.1 LLM class flavin-dependent oxidoreductase [Rhodococcus rhodochrous]QHG83668.1 LLM class flavin-dependent oxidoreductase [Rhodococcus rhodochrous]QOH56648.1 LLM class flavin-dependent oxidoreductase [Rhodococcus rhodochrous]WAL48686.1 LLM class flavin-dependent oxidoreductase [Rhodococcus pyridinivorans]